jgi:hypothetical protein
MVQYQKEKIARFQPHAILLKFLTRQILKYNLTRL